MWMPARVLRIHQGEAPIVVAIARGLDRVVDLFADRAPHSIGRRPPAISLTPCSPTRSQSLTCVRRGQHFADANLSNAAVTFDDLDRTALHVASRYGRTEMLRRLLDKLVREVVCMRRREWCA